METLPSAALRRSSAVSPVPSSKLVFPAAAKHTISRPRLLPDDNVANEMQLGVCIAPAGYGATTAAMQIANHLDPEHCWFTIERADNDPARMLWHLAAALRLSDQAISALQQALSVDVQVAADLLRAEVERLAEPTLLVLDGLHHLEDAALVRTIADWVDVPSPNLRLLCTSRREPGFPLDRVRARGRLFELGAEDLAFTRAEASEVLDNLDSVDRPHRSVVDELWERTAGWPAAFYLSACELDGDVAEVPASLGRYLEVEVLADLSPRIRQFLLETSVLESLRADLCSELTGEPDALAILEGLSHNHVLTTRTGSPEATFSYHPMLRQHLRNELCAIDVEQYRTLSTRAAIWFQDRGDLVSAIPYATQAHNVPLGKRLVSESWRSVADRKIFDSVRTWARTMGPDATADGIVCTILAWGALAHEDMPSMQSWIERARAYTTEATSPTVIASTELILAHSHGVSGELEQMRAHVALAQAVTAAAERDDQSSGVMPALRVAVSCIDGICALLSGDVERGADVLRAANLPVREPDQEQALLDVLNYLALAEALLGNLDQALVHADEAILRKKRKPGISPSCSMAHLTQSIAYLAAGHWEGATEALQRSEQALDTQIGPVQRGLIHLQAARLHHFRGQLDDAHLALASASEIERDVQQSVLAAQIRSIKNEFRFIGRGSNDQLPPEAREVTRREVEVIRALRGPKSRREVAGQLHISENTLKTHMTSISRKLNASGRQDIVTRAVDLGILA